MDTDKKTPTQKTKQKRKWLVWLAADVLFLGTLAGLLLYKPPGYRPVDLHATPEEGPHQVSRYLTYLYSELHNNAQKKETFDIEVLEEGINQAIASANWPQHSDGIVFAQPTAAFDETGVTVVGTANIEGVDLVVTIHGQLQILEDGKLNLHVDRVKIGAINITLVAKYIAKNMYEKQFGMLIVEGQDPKMLVAAALLQDKPFDPVFEISGRKVRLIRTHSEKNKVMLTFHPVGQYPPDP